MKSCIDSLTISFKTLQRYEMLMLFQKSKHYFRNGKIMFPTCSGMSQGSHSCFSKSQKDGFYKEEENQISHCSLLPEF